MDDKELAALLRQAMFIIDRIESNKTLYGQLDEITDKIRAAKIKQKDLKKAGLRIVNNFWEKNVVFRPAAIRHFELKKVG